VGIVGIPVVFFAEAVQKSRKRRLQKKSAIAAADRIPGEVIQQS
jgi:hypothetical protein